MNCLGYTWIGVGVPDFPAAATFFHEILGMPLQLHLADRDIALFQLPSGQQFEIMGPRAPEFARHATPVIAFEVDDVAAARAELQAKGVPFTSDIEAMEGVQWIYFRGPGGLLYQLCHHDALPASP